MTPGRKTRARGKKTATRKKAADKSTRGSRKRSDRSNDGRAAHEAAAGARVARAPRRRKAPAKAVTSASTSQRASAEDGPQVVFEAMTAILAPYMNLFEADMHPSLGYRLKACSEGANEILFAGVRWSREKLFFDLFPLQRHLDLREQIGPDLRARLVDDWSFGFERVEPELFVQLAELTAQAFERLQSEGLAPPMHAA